MTRFRLKIVLGFLLILFASGTLKYALFWLYRQGHAILLLPASADSRIHSLIGWTSLGIAGALVTYWLTAGAVREFSRLVEAAGRMRDGDLSARVQAVSRSMTEPVCVAFNDMANRLESLVKEQEELLQMLSHELRTPMARVRFIMDDMSDAASRSEIDHALAALDTEVTEMDELIAEVLGTARARHGDPPERRPVELAWVLDAILPKLKEQQPGIEIVIAAGDEALPPICVEQTAFKRVLRNLLSNAVRHARGSVRLEASLEGEKLLLAVEDDGPGIVESNRSKIFDAFVRLPGNHDTRMGGVGLGLTIVDRIVRAHGGQVVVTRGQLGGARFETRWPVAPAMR